MSNTQKISFIFFIKPLLTARELKKEFKTNDVEYILDEQFLELTGSPKQKGLLSALAISAKVNSICTNNGSGMRYRTNYTRSARTNSQKITISQYRLSSDSYRC